MNYMKEVETLMTSGKTTGEILNGLERLNVLKEIDKIIEEVKEFRKHITQIK